ncbi:MAG: magnesium protoporphyrin IX methyltransferase [Myxococcota bacterium]
MSDGSYIQRRGQLEAYFDRTAADAWAKLTSDGPVSRIRETVRAGRNRMRAALLDALPADLSGARILDAGCGTGAFSLEAARRGADVVAIDLSETLVALAQNRTTRQLTAGSGEHRGSLEFRVGDMLDESLGRFDYVVAMDSLIHYRVSDMVDMVSKLCGRASSGMVFTFAPRTPLLTLMLWLGRLFPRRDRAPAIMPVSERTLRRRLRRETRLHGWTAGETTLIKSGFYTSQALRMVRS